MSSRVPATVSSTRWWSWPDSTTGKSNSRHVRWSSGTYRCSSGSSTSHLLPASCHRRHAHRRTNERTIHTNDLRTDERTTERTNKANKQTNVDATPTATAGFCVTSASILLRKLPLRCSRLTGIDQGNRASANEHDRPTDRRADEPTRATKRRRVGDLCLIAVHRSRTHAHAHISPSLPLSLSLPRMHIAPFAVRAGRLELRLQSPQCRPRALDLGAAERAGRRKVLV